MDFLPDWVAVGAIAVASVAAVGLLIRILVGRRDDDEGAG